MQVTWLPDAEPRPRHVAVAAAAAGGPASAAGAHVRLTDADGLIAIAEPREGGMLKPVVGFRG